MAFSSVELKPQTPVSFPEIPDYTFQQALNQLDGLLSPKTALFLIVRREGSLVAVTFVPYLANAELKALLLENRDAIFQALGKEQISMSIICKEIGEITDTRSWEERDGNGHSWGDDHCKDSNCEECGPNETKENSVKDLGYKKNKCRLCDRRMTNKIEDNALQALSKLTKDGDCVQIVSNFNIVHWQDTRLFSKSLSTYAPRSFSSTSISRTSAHRKSRSGSPPIPRVTHFFAIQQTMSSTSSFAPLIALLFKSV